MSGTGQGADGKVRSVQPILTYGFQEVGSQATVLYQYRLDGTGTGDAVLWRHSNLKEFGDIYVKDFD